MCYIHKTSNEFGGMLYATAVGHFIRNMLLSNLVITILVASQGSNSQRVYMIASMLPLFALGIIFMRRFRKSVAALEYCMGSYAQPNFATNTDSTTFGHPALQEANN